MHDDSEAQFRPYHAIDSRIVMQDDNDSGEHETVLAMSIASHRELTGRASYLEACQSVGNTQRRWLGGFELTLSEGSPSPA